MNGSSISRARAGNRTKRVVRLAAVGATAFLAVVWTARTPGIRAADESSAIRSPGLYPLDGWEYTGIRRLRAYQMLLDGQMPGSLALPAGAWLPASAVRLRMAGVNESFDIGPEAPRDPELQAGLQRILSGRHPSYRAALLDITRPSEPRYAAVREEDGYYPGSVGKLLVMTAVFDQLRGIYPDDTEARAEVLRDTWVVADEFAMPNSHRVPVVADDWSEVTHRSVRLGDRFTLWEWIDHAVSPSSNAAGAIAWKQALLMDEFGRRYPPSKEAEAAFLRDTPRSELTERSIRVIEDPLVALGLDTATLHIRGYFTSGAQRVIPPRPSRVSPRELLRWLLKLEQGKLVDRWSSLEMKKLIYFTRRRYRYAASPALADAAVFFKSGSLYRCRPEPDYECVQYRGNAENLMHSVAIVESPATPGPGQRAYLFSMMSNVFKVNSAQEHMEIAAQVDRLIRDVNP